MPEPSRGCAEICGVFFKFHTLLVDATRCDPRTWGPCEQTKQGLKRNFFGTLWYMMFDFLSCFLMFLADFCLGKAPFVVRQVRFIACATAQLPELRLRHWGRIRPRSAEQRSYAAVPKQKRTPIGTFGTYIFSSCTMYIYVFCIRIAWKLQLRWILGMAMERERQRERETERASESERATEVGREVGREGGRERERRE